VSKTGKKSDFVDLAERINQAVSFGGGYEGVAGRSGIPKSTLQKYGTGVSEPRATALPLIARACGVDLIWLATGEGELRSDWSAHSSGGSNVRPWGTSMPGFGEQPSELPLVTEGASSLEYVQIYDVAASAGHGAAVFDEPSSDMMAFPASWLRRQVGASPQALACIYAEGDSMEPEIRSGDILLVNRAVTEPRGEGVYVVSLDGDLLVKRLQRAGLDKLVLKASNPAYDPVTIDLKSIDDNFRIIGRVSWVGRNL
jgi:phage repressor protein C with HTH and peptisase S24 domain